MARCWEVLVGVVSLLAGVAPGVVVIRCANTLDWNAAEAGSRAAYVLTGAVLVGLGLILTPRVLAEVKRARSRLEAEEQAARIKVAIDLIKALKNTEPSELTARLEKIETLLKDAERQLPGAVASLLVGAKQVFNTVNAELEKKAQSGDL